jgi:hypothetical protein
VKNALTGSWDRVETAVNSGTYRNSSGWPFVAIVVAFIGAFLVCGYFELPSAIHSSITGLVGVVLGGAWGRTYKPNK